MDTQLLKGVLSNRWILEFQLLKSVLSDRWVLKVPAVEKCFDR